MKKEKSLLAQFFGYVVPNIFGMLGMSAYVLADTYFISKAQGAAGITALNLVLPIYNIIYAFGSMTALGSATEYKIMTAQGKKNAESYFANALIFAFILSIPFMAAGLLFPDKILRFMGADEAITVVGTQYTRIFMSFAPFFMWNYVVAAFVRNDNDPKTAMIATFSSSIFNVIFDYILMFPLGMGMPGAALATAFSPVVGILICITHFFKKDASLKLKKTIPSLKKQITACKIGFSAFIGEISSAVILLVFNTLILRLTGNNGVAAYGVIANVYIVTVSIFNGITQGGQPLISETYGRGEIDSSGKILKYSWIMAEIAALIMLAVMMIFPAEITAIFNSEKNAEMAEIAVSGFRLYFLCLLFSGFNIVGIGYLGATEQALKSFLSSIFRGLVGVVIIAFVFSVLFGMTGIWLTVPMVEFITAIMVTLFIKSK
ncbi:MAG: MATE family efflux transporter [Lachnospiraceae bacterium]|nr:MATE family efflux transporter [Lachnospiraceae bacterium]